MSYAKLTYFVVMKVVCNESTTLYLHILHFIVHTENSNFMSSISVLYKHNMQNI